MEISWSTFILEMVNFVVLVWILQRFLYRPVLDVISRRRARIQKTLADAQALRDEAQGLRQRYEGRLADWNAEKQQAAEALRREIDAERAKRLEELQTQLKQQKDLSEAAEQHRLAAAKREMEMRAIEQAARFTTRLLERARGPEVEARLADAAVAELEHLPDAQRAELDLKKEQPVRIESAFPLPDENRAALEQALQALVGRRVAVEFAVDPDLLAGVRIEIGAKTIAFNLSDELEGFALTSHAE